MLFNERIEAVVTIREHVSKGTGGPYWEAALISDDGQTLHIYEGQLKEVPNASLEVGVDYKVVFRPFINNRWVEFKIVGVEPTSS
jgi:hypothetical protein